MPAIAILSGFLFLFLLYQLAEAIGQGLLRFPGKPYSFFLLFALVIPAAALVARLQGAPGLAAYGMGFDGPWAQKYLAGLGLGLALQTVFEALGFWLGIRRVLAFHFTWKSLLGSALWILFANFPAAAAEDLITRGYLWRFMSQSPVLMFVLASAALFTANHVIRIAIRPLSDWYFIPFLGLTLAFALYSSGSLWLVIGLHQAGNIAGYVLHQSIDFSNTPVLKNRILFGVASELLTLALLVVILPLL